MWKSDFQTNILFLALQDLCDRHSVDMTLRNHKQPGFAAMTEEVFEEIDQFFDSTSNTTTALPNDVLNAILIVRKIHNGLSNKVPFLIILYVFCMSVCLIRP